MKSMINGGLNLSVLDGWWAEAYDGTNGWALPGEVQPDAGTQDARDAGTLYRLLEQEVVPTFYDRDAGGLPRAWLAGADSRLTAHARAGVHCRADARGLCRAHLRTPLSADTSLTHGAMRVRASPTIYEINTAAWLQRVGRERRRAATLGDVPGSEWDALAALPVDALWLMGVWQLSPIGRTIALAVPQLLDGYRAALPDMHEDDVLGSPYCVRDYVVDDRFGGPGGLVTARDQLHERGVALILDYVPNHVAADHPWVSDRSECLLAGSEDDLALHPQAFMRTAGGVYAKARDPYFEPWQDVLQLNAFSPELRRAAAETMATIADQCDGVRCDMAMLMTSEVFSRTWGNRAGSVPDAEFWPADWPLQGGASRFRVGRRGVLGHGMDASAAGL
jgi:hypothetical protein